MRSWLRPHLFILEIFSENSIGSILIRDELKGLTYFEGYKFLYVFVILKIKTIIALHL